ncbi:MAG: protein kinase [Verrucomicrobia bacterium]|nr:protein kinase [Verrucomicrobiota bacterium]
MPKNDSIAGYEIVEKVGQGGVGSVYRARQPMLNRTVALKVLAPHLAGDAEYVARFRREATAAAQLNHLGIVAIYSAGEHDGTHYIAMEYVEGETLARRLERHGRLETTEAIAICVYLAEALRYAWDKARLIHRDIKPDNIFLSTKGEVKLGDLGLARCVGGDSARVTLHGTAWGTPHYMSPEQARGERDLDLRSDIYSLGCTLYCMISGQTPYDGADVFSVMNKHVNEPPPTILKVLPTCPMPVVLLLAKMLAKHPNDRHQDYDELITDLQDVHQQLTNPQASPSAAANEPPKPAPAKMPLAMIYGMAGAVAVVVLAGVMLWAPWKERGTSTREATTSESQVVPENASTATAPQPKPETVSPPVAPAPMPAVSQQPAAATQTVATVTATNAPAVASAAPAGKTPAPVGAMPSSPATNAPATAPLPAPVDAVFIAAVAALPPETQVQTVIAKLKDLNPDFDGQAAPTVENNKVIGLAFSTASAGDLTPLKALSSLQSLGCPGTAEKQSLTNLAALAGLPLTNLNCSFSKVSDLSPLRGMPLAMLACKHASVTNFAALRELPLKRLDCDFDAARDREALWAVGTLEMINGQPAAEFWHEMEPPQDEFGSMVAALPATQQVAQVVAKLRELNPEFDGRVTRKIADGKVTEIGFSTVAVQNISPVAALRSLERLSLVPVGSTNVAGQLADLSPLRGLWLTALWCQNNPVSDLRPLRGQPLTVLGCGGTQVTDLSPLGGMPLTVLSCDHTDVHDLSPVAGAPLQTLWCQKTKVTDLTVLTNMPLRELRCDFLAARDGAVLRGIPTLQRINGQTTAMFWLRESGAKIAAKAAPRTTKPSQARAPAAASSLSGKQMLQRFIARMKEANPGFGGGVEPTFEGDKLTGLTFATEAVADLSPVRDVLGLVSLRCLCGTTQGLITKLSPLSGLPLKTLVASGNHIKDLTALQTTSLTELALDSNPVSDLRGLEGLRLSTLNLTYTPVSDISLLAGMPLTALHLGGTKVRDLAPLKRTPLKTLDIGLTEVSDLTPLRGMKLGTLILEGSKVSDITPLRGMPLSVLLMGGTAITSLGPLKGMPLSVLNFNNTRISDLTPIRGCPITSLSMVGTQVTSLTLLNDMALTVLHCGSNRITDLAPLRDKALTSLRVNDTGIKDLAPLRRMPLTELWIQNTKVSDLSLLRTMPLQVLKADIVPERDAVILGNIKTLTTINDQPAAEFLKKLAADR